MNGRNGKGAERSDESVQLSIRRIYITLSREMHHHQAFLPSRLKIIHKIRTVQIDRRRPVTAVYSNLPAKR